MRVAVIVAGQVFDLETDLEDGLEVLKNQIFSLTDMPLEELILVPEGGQALSDSTDLSLALSAFPRIYAKRAAPELPSAWQDTCTRVFTEEAISQPAYRSGDLLVCGGCVALCRDGEENEMDPHQDRFTCQCFARNHGCLFACRSDEYYAQNLQEVVKEKMKSERLATWKQFFSPGIQAITMWTHRLRHLSVRLGEESLHDSCLLALPKELFSSEEKGKTKSFLEKLLSWFKSEFFHWQSTPMCVACGNFTRISGRAQPSEDEMRGLATTVEMYVCPLGHQNRLPRFFDPGKLIETRIGRSEEWSVAFAAIATACGFTVRLLTDCEERMWNEVWVDGWIHCDGTEGKIDAPGLYETEKKAKVAYVIAGWKNGVKDVTMRYVTAKSELKTRRTRVPEPWLSSHIAEITAKMRESLTADERKIEEAKSEDEDKSLRNSSEEQKEEMDIETEVTQKIDEKPTSEPMEVEEKTTTVEEKKESPSSPEIQSVVASPTKKEFKAAVEAAFAQLTKGCGAPHCDNPHCFSNLAAPRVPPSKAALTVLSLLREKKFRFCGAPPPPP